jgi:hypothetical protein
MGKLAEDVGDLGLAAFDSGSAAWAVGGIGEWYVGEILNGLPEGWYITHDVTYGARGQNLDHVLVGPPGVFVVNSKYLGNKPVLVEGETFRVVGEQRPYVAQGRREAKRVSDALTRASGGTVAAGSLLAVVSFNEFRVAEQPKGAVRVAHVTTLRRQLVQEAIKPLSECVRRRLTRLVRDPKTWTTDEGGHPTSDPP